MTVMKAMILNYPGGSVIWGTGYLAANTVTEDLRIEKWWKEPEFVTRAKEAGIL
ncbi:MAG: hypothetical protein KAJ00_02630 [Deltaproteobacteria bacterium]|jgi:hypothetical protein|nr:hypothetical protein [Deltaproteobacteria bacterium]